MGFKVWGLGLRDFYCEAQIPPLWMWRGRSSTSFQRWTSSCRQPFGGCNHAWQCGSVHKWGKEPQYRPQNIIILIMGTPKKVPLILERPILVSLQHQKREATVSKNDGPLIYIYMYVYTYTQIVSFSRDVPKRTQRFIGNSRYTIWIDKPTQRAEFVSFATTAVAVS